MSTLPLFHNASALNEKMQQISILNTEKFILKTLFCKKKKTNSYGFMMKKNHRYSTNK